MIVQSEAFGAVRDAATEAVSGEAIDDTTSTLFVIDDDDSRRESLELLVRTAGWEAEGFVPCCVILDLTVRRPSGLELQQRLAARPAMPVVFISSKADVPMTVQAMKAGAVDVLTRPVNPAALLHAIRAAMERSSVALRRNAEAQMVRRCYSSLTPRERQVMTLVVSGLLNKQVAGELGISEVTVKAHRGQVMRKMEAASLPHLVMMAAQLECEDPRTTGTTRSSKMTIEVNQ